ncbi:leukotriene C4 synthase isoform X2 [Tamandua tetradactyla]|uniref:leukotriene C4 synthase isoform X2 n=1 Tax=Tamandua tetradactyla TaxID=48850 RepID=UPI004053C931
MKDEVALLAAVTLLGVLLQGDLGAQGIPRAAAAHHRAARVPARLPSPGELQRELPTVSGRALGRRHLLPPRDRGVMRPGLPLSAPALLPGLRSLPAAKASTAVRERVRQLAAAGTWGARPAPPLPPGRVP